MFTSKFGIIKINNKVSSLFIVFCGWDSNLYPFVRDEEERVLGRVRDVRVDDSAGRHVLHSADALIRIFRHNPGLVTLLHDDERDACDEKELGLG